MSVLIDYSTFSTPYIITIHQPDDIPKDTIFVLFLTLSYSGETYYCLFGNHLRNAPYEISQIIKIDKKENRIIKTVAFLW